MNHNIYTAMYSEDYICAMLKIALSQFYSRDYYLVNNCVAERSMTHRLAVYLEQLFPTFHVDCEYNKWNNGGIVNKKIRVNCLDRCNENCAGKDRYKRIVVCEDGFFHPYVFPDIIVHKRDNDDLNLLIIEAKKEYGFSCKKNIVFDLCKLKSYIEQYKYQYAAFISFENSFDDALHRIQFFVNKNNKVQEIDFCNFSHNIAKIIDLYNYKDELLYIKYRLRDKLVLLLNSLEQKNTPLAIFKFYAEKNNAIAQCGLGISYDIGDEVEQNFEKAKNLYSEAAEQGNADAQFLLGEWYRIGRCVAQNIMEATKLYRKAAKQGHPRAIEQLKKMGK